MRGWFAAAAEAEIEESEMVFVALLVVAVAALRSSWDAIWQVIYRPRGGILRLKCGVGWLALG